MLLIKTPSIHSVFPLFAISLKQLFRSILQNFADVIRKCLYWCSSLKTKAANIQEKTSSKFLSCEICEIFQNRFFLEQLSANVSVSGVGPAQPYQSNKDLIWLTKQINTLTSNQSYFVKQLLPSKKVGTFSNNYVHDGVLF